METTRRAFVRSSVAASVLAKPVLARAGLTMADGRAWPTVKVANINDLKPGEPISFTYPDTKSPALLVKLKTAAYEGVGPGADIVAFSATCTHMGCLVGFVGERFVCPCHYSMFDPAKNGQVYQGLASDYLPQIALEIDGAGDIHAMRMSGLVWGRASDRPLKG